MGKEDKKSRWQQTRRVGERVWKLLRVEEPEANLPGSQRASASRPLTWTRMGPGNVSIWWQGIIKFAQLGYFSHRWFRPLSLFHPKFRSVPSSLVVVKWLWAFGGRFNQRYIYILGYRVVVCSLFCQVLFLLPVWLPGIFPLPSVLTHLTR